MDAESVKKKSRNCKYCGMTGHYRTNFPVNDVASPNCSVHAPAVFHSRGEIVAAPPIVFVDPLIYDDNGNPVNGNDGILL